MFRAGQVISERYRLVEPLGEGGMGSVWRAHHVQLEKTLAIKLMSETTASNDILRSRFQREARATAQLVHKHVIRVFDFGFEGEVPFIAMEQLVGADLRTLTRTQRFFSLAETTKIIREAASGLSFAHAAGIVHRDVKPSNLFLATIDGATVTKVIDFGIAKLLDPDTTSVTRSGTALGSPRFMAPEQLMGSEVDARADVWGLGIVAFLLLTGDLPFQGRTPMVVATKVGRGERARPTEVVAGLPAELDAFFDRALAVERDGRFGSVLELSSALETIDKARPKAIASTPEAPAAVPSAAPLTKEDDNTEGDDTTQVQVGSRTTEASPASNGHHPARTVKLEKPPLAQEQEQAPRPPPPMTTTEVMPRSPPRPAVVAPANPATKRPNLVLVAVAAAILLGLLVVLALRARNP